MGFSYLSERRGECRSLLYVWIYQRGTQNEFCVSSLKWTVCVHLSYGLGWINSVITDQQTSCPFKRLTWTAWNVLLLRKGNQVFILHGPGLLLFHRLGVLGAEHLGPRRQRIGQNRFTCTWLNPKLRAKLSAMTWIHQTSSVRMEITTVLYTSKICY